MALKVHEWGLRPLVMHVDAGWNSELAVANIEKIVKFCSYDLHTYVVDWEEMRDLQLAYLRAGVANQDVPQDHVFFGSLYRFAVKHGIKYVLSGGNIATESIFPSSWHGSAMDATNLRAIHRKFGTRRLKRYKTIGFLEYYFWYPFVRGLRTVRPLNYMSYNKQEATNELEEKIGWRSYGRKHGESIFTKFFQNYYLPAKFGYDKRRPHLASLIMSGQMTREEALDHLEEPLYLAEELDRDIEYLCKKLGISKDEFDSLMEVPAHSHKDFSNWLAKQSFAKKGQNLISKMLGRRVKIYS
jgi:N-acetyl sugar amidotransferase